MEKTSEEIHRYCSWLPLSGLRMDAKWTLDISFFDICLFDSELVCRRREKLTWCLALSFYEPPKKIEK